MSKLRLFFALQPSAGQCARIVEEVAPLVAELGARALSASNIHATLCFLGAIEAERLDALREVGARVRGSLATLRFDLLEHWIEPALLCATAKLDEAAASAESLARSLGEFARAAGFSPDAKPFRPHLTLARKVSRERASAMTFPRDLSPPLVLHCDEFVLMESHRDDDGSVYSVVDSWPLDEKSRA